MSTDPREDTFVVGVVVRARIPASNAGEALGLLCQSIREGIGPDTDDPRRWDTSIALGTARSVLDSEAKEVRVNQAFVIDLGKEMEG